MKRVLTFLLSLAVLGSFAFASGQQEAGDDASQKTDQAKTYVFKYAHTQSPAHPRSQSMDFFKEQLEKASNGRIKVELYYNGVLGTEAELLDMVKLGSVQGCRGGLFERANKKFLIYTLPFMFTNTDQVQKVMFGPIGQEINKGAFENGLYIPATGVAGGFRNITNNIKPITSVEDIKGLKMRTPPIDMTIKTFKTLGANPQQVAYTETYMALKTGVVDGQENPFSNTVDMKFYEPQKYLSVVNWQIHPDPFYVNPDWYNSLPEDLKAIFDSVAESTMKYSNEKWLGSEKEYFLTLKENLEVNELTPEAHAEFVEAAKPVWQGYVDDGYFTWDEINAVLEAAE
ncbi:MAG: TRAP transporter substrate-binding protein [Spirochaetales bacterium]|nr:TRAP transporter substrate-binding protein [Spirochaetales bacterium]